MVDLAETSDLIDEATTRYDNDNTLQYNIDVESQERIDADAYAKTYIDTLADFNGLSKMNLITWSELKNIRDTSMLVRGQQYRITDYECTIQARHTKCRSCFDIMLLLTMLINLMRMQELVYTEGDIFCKSVTSHSLKGKYIQKYIII